MPISAPRDNNYRPMLLGTLNTDGQTVVAIKVNSSNHAIKVSDGSTGTDHQSGNDQRDANRVPTIWGVSSADGVTPVYIATDSSGNLLIQST